MMQENTKRRNSWMATSDEETCALFGRSYAASALNAARAYA